MTDFIIQALDVNQIVTSADGELQILKNINLNIQQGESIAIVGASGSGKTTLLGLLAGLDTPSGGQIFLAGNEITAMSEEQRAQVRGQQVGFVFQNFQLLGSLSALENVMLPLEVKDLKNAGDRAKTLLERVGLGNRMNHYPNQLSGGEQQRVAVARAFAADSPVLFADEPTGNLDSKTGDTISDLLFELNKEFGTTLVMVTHDAQLAERCDRQIHIHGGEMVEAS